MAQPSSNRWFLNHRCMRLVLILVGVILVGCIVGQSFFLHSIDNPSAQAPCPSCSCDCYSESRPLGLFNISSSDCDEDDDLDIFKEIVTNDNLQHTKHLINNVEKISSHYQREAEKCNAGVETCERAREKAEAALIEERKLYTFWKNQAYRLGWKDERRVYTYSVNE